jgi:hypothetical protein
MEGLIHKMVEFQSTGGKNPDIGGKKKSNGGIILRDG